ncbi:MAG: GNAT family N-acetyltransferase, partial [Acidimicrobiia bacterium]|nr:GNAT family N-acetyltransferase [Acidimicrobiia bacterium]
MAGADPDDLIAAYPREWETHAVLADGETVEVRPIRPADREALVDFHSRQSSESIYFRFFRHRPELSDDELDFFTQVDYRNRMAFVVFDGGQLVAIARYEHGSLPEAVAEVAFFVDDANHGRGLATLLLEYLAAAARANGFSTF